MRKVKDKKDKKKLRRLTSKRPCRFCSDKENVIDYKRTKMLSDFLSDRCTIIPRKMAGNCRYHQSKLVQAIKRARQLAMLPYTIQHVIRESY